MGILYAASLALSSDCISKGGPGVGSGGGSVSINSSSSEESFDISDMGIVSSKQTLQHKATLYLGVLNLGAKNLRTFLSSMALLAGEILSLEPVLF
jgi:hypothetical protein